MRSASFSASGPSGLAASAAWSDFGVRGAVSCARREAERQHAATSAVSFMRATLLRGIGGHKEKTEFTKKERRERRRTKKTNYWVVFFVRLRLLRFFVVNSVIFDSSDVSLPQSPATAMRTRRIVTTAAAPAAAPAPIARPTP